MKEIQIFSTEPLTAVGCSALEERLTVGKTLQSQNFIIFFPHVASDQHHASAFWLIVPTLAESNQKTLHKCKQETLDGSFMEKKKKNCVNLMERSSISEEPDCFSAAG